MKPCIVIVEDDEVVRVAFEVALSESAVILSFPTGEEAIASLERFNGIVACVVTDIHLPGISGIDLIRILRGMPKWHSLPIVAITADSSPHLKASALAAGAGLFFNKPCSLLQLRESLKKLIYA